MRVYREAHNAVSWKAAKTALAALLSFLLVTSAVISVSHTLHKKLHTEDASPGHFCLVCSLSKGQITPAEAAPILTIFVVSVFFLIPVLRTAPLRSVDRRLAPNRGPPAPPSSRRVVG
jgi:small neutral amino acid transporter SnatA (MarC family)